MEISESAPVLDAKWPLWTWFAYPALAIAIGGGLGYFVASVRQEPEPRQPIHATVETIVAAPQPSMPAPSPPEIEIAPDLVRVAPKPKAKPKPIKTTRCNVYDHMNGC